jgi:hypothetical protein
MDGDRMTGDRTMLVLPGGGYRTLAPHEAEPIADWVTGLGWDARIVRYPVGVPHPAPIEAVRDAVRRARADGARTVGRTSGRAASSPATTRRSRPSCRSRRS